MRKTSRLRSQILLHGVLLLIAAGMLMPVIWMVSTSLKTFEEVLADPPRFFPAHAQWANYAVAFGEFEFGRYLTNSCLLTGLVMAGTLISCTLAGYAFAVLRCRGKTLLFSLLLSTMMLPGQVTIIPLFKLFVWLGWINTYIPIVLPAWLGGNVFGIFLLRQFFRTIPLDYVDAGRLDGASEPRILWSVFVPLSKPALLTVAVFTFVGSWNDLWGPLIYLHDDRLYTLPIGLLNFIGMIGRPEGTPWQIVMASATVMMIPIVIVFFLAQKRFIEGITMTGVKG